MSEENSFNKAESRYKKYINSFSFINKEDVDEKVQRVFYKLLIISLYLSICGISSNYVYAVFFGSEERDFPLYFMDYIDDMAFWVFMVVVGFVITSLRIILKKLYNYAYSNPIRSEKRQVRLICVAKQFPELKHLIVARVKEQGFVSEMDYNTLCIDNIYEEINQSE